MATKEEMAAKYTEQLEECGVKVDSELLDWVIGCVGPANYKADAQLVAASDEEELGRVYKGFVGDELAETDKEKGMAAIHEVAAELKEKGISRKYRAVFYYLLAKKYGK